MVYVEVLFSTGNSAGYTDGMPISVMGSGALISSAEIVDWFQNSIIPPAVSGLEPNIRAETKREASRVKYLSAGGRTAAEAAVVRFGLAYTNGTPQEKAQMEATVQVDINNAIIDRAVYLTDGYDTNWHYSQLKTAGVIPADLPPAIIKDLIREQTDTVPHPMEPRNRVRARRWRVPYENLAPSGMVANFRNPNVRVDVQRQITPFTKSQIKQAL